MQLEDVVKRISNLPFEATYCAAADAVGRSPEAERVGLHHLHDSEMWPGNIHPAQALRQYRSEFVGGAKAVVVGMTSNGFTLADPNDPECSTWLASARQCRQ